MRWLVYTFLIAAPALLAWEDLFATLATHDTTESLLRAGTPSSYALFVSALALPLLYAAAARLRAAQGLLARQVAAVPLLYLFAATGHIANAIVFASIHTYDGDRVGFLWAVWLTLIYLPVVTVAVVILNPPDRVR